MAKDGNSIQHLSGNEAVRRRPGMYIGGADVNALHELFFGALDHMLNNALDGQSDQINITLLHDNEVSISDNSRGFPIGIVEMENASVMELVT